MISELLYRNWLNLDLLQKGLSTYYIRWSWSGWQKRNKTSSTVQIVDNFNYLPYVPEINKQFVKWVITIKADRGRSQIDNYNYAIEDWHKILKKYFFVTKERAIDWEKEKKRKRLLSLEHQDRRSKQEYRSRNDTPNFDF